MAELLQTLTQTVDVRIHANCSGRKFSEIFAETFLQLSAYGKKSQVSFLHVLAFQFHLFSHEPPMSLAHHGSCHQCPPQADGFDVRCTESQRFKEMIFQGQAASNGNGWNIGPFCLEPFAHLIGQALQLYCRDTPFTHHPPRTHTCTASGTVYGQQIYFGV